MARVSMAAELLAAGTFKRCVTSLYPIHACINGHHTPPMFFPQLTGKSQETYIQLNTVRLYV
jgi:hypothetical protein